MADGEEELEAVVVDHKLSRRQKFALYKDLEGYRSPRDTSYFPSKNKQPKEKVAKKERRRRVKERVEQPPSLFIHD